MNLDRVIKSWILKALVVLIIKVGHRGDVYKKL